MNSNSVSISINDVFDELKAENSRLRTELLLANKCIEILSEFKFFLDSIRDKFGEKLDQKLILTFNRLDDRYKRVVDCRQTEICLKKSKEKKIPLKYSFACDWVGCHYKTNRKSRLSAHHNYHTGSRPFLCLKCEKRFVGKESLSKHKTVHNKSIQLKARKKTNKKQILVLSEEKPFKCENCEYKSRTRQALREHKWTHADRTLLCPICQKGFKSKKQLKSHSLTHCLDPPFKCDVTDCSAAFRTQKTLRIHISKHNNSAPVFACDWPGCEFSSNYNWIARRHRIIHSEDKPFECEWPDCDQRFRRSHYLKQHLLKHTGEKPFSCEWPGCERAFQSRQALRSHRKRH